MNLVHVADVMPDLVMNAHSKKIHVNRTTVIKIMNKDHKIKEENVSHLSIFNAILRILSLTKNKQNKLPN